MTLNVLIVDDSPFFLRLLSEIINEHPQLQVVGTASNGQEAIDRVKSLKPDVVTMDYEMPMMDGVTAVRIIMSENPLPILMLSSMTYTGAKITMDALEAGAVDFMTKNFSEISHKSDAIKRRLYNTLLAVSRGFLDKKEKPKKESVLKKSPVLGAKATEEKRPTIEKVKSPLPEIIKGSTKKQTTDTSLGSNGFMERKPNSTTPENLYETSVAPKIVAIGASTGGPSALMQILKNIPKSFPLPILLIQHMPENFTLAFSERLNKQCNIFVKQAEDGDLLEPGKALLAPGGKQLLIDNSNKSKVRIVEPANDINYKPCVDISFASLSNTYGKETLAIVLTGMGSDGCDGARLLKEKQATIWTQEETSCIVYGMPMAIDNAKLSNASLELESISRQLCLLT